MEKKRQKPFPSHASHGIVHLSLIFGLPVFPASDPTIITLIIIMSRLSDGGIIFSPEDSCLMIPSTNNCPSDDARHAGFLHDWLLIGISGRQLVPVSVEEMLLGQGIESEVLSFMQIPPDK